MRYSTRDDVVYRIIELAGANGPGRTTDEISQYVFEHLDAPYEDTEAVEAVIDMAFDNWIWGGR